MPETDPRQIPDIRLGIGLAPPLGGEDLDPESARDRKLRRAESHVAWMRDAVAAFVWTTVPFLATRPATETTVFVPAVLLATAHTVLAHLAHVREWGRLSRRALLTSTGDAVLVLSLLSVTGGWVSPLTPLLYVSMAAVAYRYELGSSLAFGTAYALGYVAILFATGWLGAVNTVDVVLRAGLLVATGMLAALSSASYLEAEIRRSRTEHAIEGILETVPGDVAVITREAALPQEDGRLPRRRALRAALPDWMPEEGIGRAQEALGRVFAEEETVEFDVSRTEEDAVRTYRSLAGPLREGGETVAAVVVSRDVTERKRAQRRLRDQTRALRQSNQALAKYASLTAHDLREPLRDIVRYLQRMNRRETDLDPESREELEFVVERARRLDSLVRALHGFAEVDGRPFRTESVDLEEALDRALIELDLSGPPRLAVQTGDLGTITADRRAIVEVLAHLLDNAYQHAGGDVVHVRVEAEETDAGWEITVEDDGRGIPPRYHEQIFEPFQRLEPDPRSERPGMGLATVRRLVERLGGEVYVDSRPGEGARFTFTVPRRSVLGGPRMLQTGP